MADQGAVEVLFGEHAEEPVDLKACMDAKGRSGCARLLLNEPASR